MFGVVEDAVQRFGRMHKIERPTLRQFLNTQRSAIFRIPLETLSTIFICATSVQDDPLEEKDALGRCHIRRAVAISHVCSRWYNVAVSCSALWTVCNVDTPRRLIEMALERSSQRPLAFLATGGPYFQTEGSNDSLEFLARHIHVGNPHASPSKNIAFFTFCGHQPPHSGICRSSHPRASVFWTLSESGKHSPHTTSSKDRRHS